MFICNTFCGFQFDNQTVFDHQIGKVIPDFCPVFIINFQRELLFYIQPGFSQTMSQCILINFLKMSMSMVFMDRISSFPNRIT